MRGEMKNSVQSAGTLNKIPAGSIVKLTPASNLPNDSEFKYFATDEITGIEIPIYENDVQIISK